jgi:hypothetical protein
VALLVITGCAHQLGARAAQTVATRLPRIEPETVSEIARGTMTGMLTDLTMPSRAAARGLTTGIVEAAK